MQQLKLSQKLLQKLSPQQILLMKLLQVPAVALEQRIKQEIEENPALEDVSIEGNVDEQTNNDDEFGSDEEFDLSDYMDEDDIPTYKLYSASQSEDSKTMQIYSGGLSFYEMLMNQLSDLVLDDKERKMAETIIGNMNDAGYLERDIESMVDDLAFSQNLQVTDEEMLQVLKMIQGFEPVGVGARDLKECLQIQLSKKDQNKSSVKIAKQILDRYFTFFIKKHYRKMMKRMELDESTLKEAIEEITNLNPKPGNSLAITAKDNHYITPDFVVDVKDDEILLHLNVKNAPDLRLNNTYKDMLETYAAGGVQASKQDKEAFLFVKQKIDSAKWFIDAIKQRQHTLYNSMRAIIDFQHDYFLSGNDEDLKPMILKDIAEKVDLDISTISRVANSKYVQTPFGTILLKDLFSEALETQSGENVSSKEVKGIITALVANEDKRKPLTDDALVAMLHKQGYKIARRTVAKYREQTGVPVARLRKELR